MTTERLTELRDIAKQAAEYMGRLNGEGATFQIDGDTLTAAITYTTDICDDEGDYYTAPGWWLENERVIVHGVYDEYESNDKEAAKWLEQQLN